MAKVTLYKGVPLNPASKDRILFDSGENSRLTITDFLGEYVNIDFKIGDVFQEYNIPLGNGMETSLTLSYSPEILSCNYVKIVFSKDEAPLTDLSKQESEYYYFISDINSEGRNKYSLTLQLDVFTTWAPQMMFKASVFTERKHCNRWKKVVHNQVESYTLYSQDALLGEQMDSKFKATVVQQPQEAVLESDLYDDDVLEGLKKYKWYYVFTSTIDTAKPNNKFGSHSFDYRNGGEPIHSLETWIKNKMDNPLSCYIFNNSNDATIYTPTQSFRIGPSQMKDFILAHGSNIIAIKVSNMPPFAQCKKSNLLISSDIQHGGIAIWMEKNGYNISEFQQPAGSDDSHWESTADLGGIGFLIDYQDGVDSNVYMILKYYNVKQEIYAYDIPTSNALHYSLKSDVPVFGNPSCNNAKSESLEPKLYTEPYCYYILKTYGQNPKNISVFMDFDYLDLPINNVGAIYRSALFGVISPEADTYALQPYTGINKYTGITDTAFSYTKSYQLPSNVNTYQDFIQKNSASINAGLAVKEVSGFSAIIGGALGVAFGGAMGKVGGAMGIVGGIEAMGSGVANYVSKIKDAKDTPDSYKQPSANPYYDETMGNYTGTEFFKVKMIDSEREMVFDYYYNNGYQVNRMCIWNPSVTGTTYDASYNAILNRKLFNYVKLNDDSLIDKMYFLRGIPPQIVKNKICELLTKGCKIWLFEGQNEIDGWTAYYLTESQENPERYFGG